MPKIKDKTGMIVGRLTVIELYSIRPTSKSTMWLCKCKCGNICVVSTENLRKGHTESCGCLAKETLKNNSQKQIKPFRNHPLYKRWLHIKTRCNPNYNKAKYYYGKGISMCEEWNNCFDSFYKWAINNGYKDGLTIDRIDNNKGYSPDNCRWVDYKIQENNRTNNKRIEYQGNTHTIAEWSRILGIKDSKLRSRIRYGWDIERAFTTP